MNKKIFFLLLTVVFVFLGCASKEPVPVEPVEKSALEHFKAGEIDEAKEKFVVKTDINEADENGDTLLHLSARKNDPVLVKYFLSKGADPDLKNKDGDTPLLTAIKADAYESAKVLAPLGTSLFSKNKDGVTALIYGLEKNNAYYDIFITEETGLIRDSDNRTIVHYFAEAKNLKAIEASISRKLNISAKDNSGKTPLDLAFDNINDISSVEVAAALIIGGADEVETDFAYFQDAVSSRNYNLRLEDGQTPLHLAAILGHNAISSYLLQNEADTSVQDSSGATPLHEAIRYGNLEIARMLLDNGANVNAKDNLGKTPIMLIVPKTRIADTYSLLIKYKADLTEKDMYGDTILHIAAMLHVDSEIFDMLTKNGADINARNKEGVTPLAIAIQQRDLETIKLLTSYGASIHTQDTHGNSPLSIALAEDSDIFEATVNESNVGSQDSEGNTPLHIALIKDAPFSKIQYIISLTDDVNIRNRDGNSALYLAVSKKQQQVGEILLSKNADIFSTNIENNSPLRIALKDDSVQQWLITSETIKSTDGSGNTVLHYAAEWKYSGAINSLLLKGADIHAKNANGETCLFSAAKTNSVETIQTIIDGGASVKERDNLGNTPLHTAVRWNALKSAKKLIELGVNVNAQNSAGKSPLAEASISSKTDTAKYLLENGADPNSSDTSGTTILMDMIHAQNVPMVKLLLSYGANPNLQEINGRNSYHEAAYMGNKQIIELIRATGVNPLSRDKQGNTPFSLVLNKDINLIMEVLGDSKNITDTDGNTPVHIVVKNKASTKILQRLINDKYPIDLRNADGYTPLAYAIEAGDETAAAILLEKGANPYQSIDKKGKNGVTIALDKNNKQIISNIVKYAGTLSDIQGNTILHYAAKTSSAETVKYLIGFGLDKGVTNVSGDTPYVIAVRWKRPEIAELLKIPGQSVK